MIVISLSSCPPALRGDLTAWLQEIDTGVFVGHLNARVRDELWLRICKHIKNGRALMVYQSNNEQRMDFRVHNTKWQPMDFDGLKLMLRPDPGYSPTKSTAPARGFSKASAYHQSRLWSKRDGKRSLSPQVDNPASSNSTGQPLSAEKAENLPISEDPAVQAPKSEHSTPGDFSHQAQAKAPFLTDLRRAASSEKPHADDDQSTAGNLVLSGCEGLSASQNPLKTGYQPKPGAALFTAHQKSTSTQQPHEEKRQENAGDALSSTGQGAVPAQNAHELPSLPQPLPSCASVGFPPYVVLDIETTGLSIGKDQMFEVAAILVVDGAVQSHYQSLIRIDAPLPAHIQTLCGISQEQLDQDGRDLFSVLSEFLAFVGKHPVVSHNAAFDYGFLRAACVACRLPPFSNPYTDTLPMARRRIKDIANYQLSTLAAYLDIRIERHHRALNDCLATHFVYEHLLSLSR